MEKLLAIAKAKALPLGSVRKHGKSFYKKTAKGWKRVSTKNLQRCCGSNVSGKQH